MMGIRRASSVLALAIGLAAALPAAAQQPEPQDTAPPGPPNTGSVPIETSQAGEVDQIVVTGSFIRGTPEDAALPVDVITADEIQKQGAPTLVELVKALPSSAGVFGDSNQFGAGQSTGTGNVNLRGLGALRTLVLLNGRRLTTAPAAGVGVDTNLLPSAGIGRIEVLKDGAAALYGSDAIGGVVNFITRDDLDGIDASANYSFINGSDGDFNFALNAGKQLGDRGHVFVSAGYRERSELSTRDRDWAIRDYFTNPGGGYSTFGNPGTYIALSPAAGAPTATTGTFPTYSAVGVFRDPACTALGGPAIFSGTTPACAYSYSSFDNLVEDEKHWQFFGDLEYELTDQLTVRLEGLYSGHDVPRENSSPGYSPVQFTTPALNGGRGAVGGGTATNGFYIPATNPGLQALFATYSCAELNFSSTAACNASRGTPGTGVGGGGVITTLLWRPFATGGNPLTGYEGKEDQRNFKGWRASGGLTYEFDDGWTMDAQGTYMENSSDIKTPDILVSRLELALRGLGGPNCNYLTGTPGVGSCLYFNPFSSGIAFNGADGRTNPRYNPNVVPNLPTLYNSFEVVDWMYEDYAYQVKNKLFVFDFVSSGQLPITLPGGQIGMAIGAQYRREDSERNVEDLSNLAVTPCIDTPVTGNTNCLNRNGALSFFGPLTNYDFNRDIAAGFIELQIPVFDSFNVQAAVRYETYGGNIGGTTNPKVAARWQVTDWLALRGSFSTTFRAPPQVQTVPTATTGLSFTSAVGGYRAYDTFGNPDLAPETADAYNGGIILQSGGFNATLDYYRFDFKGYIDNEPGGAIVNALFPNGATGANNCATLPTTNPALYARYTFLGGVCSAANLLRTRLLTVNGPDVRTSGLDFSTSFRDDFLGGRMTVGLDGTYVIEFKATEFVVEGAVVDAADDYAGKLDYQGYGSIPDIKGQFYVQYDNGAHSLRYAVRYVGELEDTRGATTFTAISPLGKVIKDYATIDLNYTLNIERIGMQLTASVQNLTDRDPSFARLDLNYDPFTGNPLGRVYKVGLRQKF